MKFIHLSDLHLGKRLNEHSLLEDQEYILTKIINIVDAEQPDAVLIAGDLYDKSVPSAEAVELCDRFLVKLAERSLQVFIISGNHDSPERLAFGNRLMEVSGVHISPVYHGHISPVSLTDEFGQVDVFMLPFVKPSTLRRFFPDQEIVSFTQAVAAALGNINRNGQHRSVLLAHQFVTGAAVGGSEELYVGGAENVDASVFDGFDYVALGHIHGAQKVGSERIRYCGTPLKYSFSEANHRKSVSVVELGEQGSLSVRTVELEPLHDVVSLRGSYDELLAKSFYEGHTWQEDYIHITLTDEDDIPNAMANLRIVYHNLMGLSYDNQRTRSGNQLAVDQDAKTKSPMELFADFYELQNGKPLNEEQTAFLARLIEEIWEGQQ